MNTIKTLNLKNFEFDTVEVKHYVLDNTITIKQIIDNEPMTIALSIYDVWAIHSFILKNM